MDRRQRRRHDGAVAVSAQADPIERERAFMSLQLVLAGERVDVGLSAAIDLLASVIELSNPSVTAADQMIRSVSRDLRDAVRRNWRTERARPGGSA